MPPAHPLLQQRLEFPFPQAEPAAGIPLCSGGFGTLLWGAGRTLRITLNRADYAQQPGEPPAAAPEAWADLTRCLAARDEAGIRGALEPSAADPDPASVPPRLPMGRVDLELPADWRLESGGLHLGTAEAELELDGHRDRAKLRATVLRDMPVFCLRLTGVDGETVQVTSRPPDAPEVLEHHRRAGWPPAQSFDLGPYGGWVQERPGLPALCAGWLRHPSAGGLLLYVTSIYGEDPVDARRRALQTLEGASGAGYTPATLRSFSGWRRWWTEAPTATFPDPELELRYYLALYRLGGECAGAAPPAVSAVDSGAARGGADRYRGSSITVKTSDGVSRVVLAGEGREIAAVSARALRPEWLDGDAIAGHLPDRPKRPYPWRND